MQFYTILCITAICFACIESNKKAAGSSDLTESNQAETSEILYSFAFVGCNRVDYTDRNNLEATDVTTANLSALKRIYRDISNLKRQPELFFFLGDLVLGESTLENLDSQLEAWVKLYKNKAFSPISDSSIEMVAVPGNHEMLTYADYGIPNQTEWPLKGATAIWMKHMQPFIPSDREQITGPDSLDNQATFTFTRDHIGFIIMNTDTYNAPTKENPYGEEGMIPLQWISDKIKVFQADESIEHIFVLGHKPYYVGGQPETGHRGLPQGPELWPLLQEHQVLAMLSAHEHDYQRMQPQGEGTYQIIAGNGGSPNGGATFFGYTIINILRNGEVELLSKGFDIGDPYYQDVPENKITIRDSTILTWTKNANPYVK